MDSNSEILQHLDGSQSTKKLIENKEDVIDDDFPPNENSLYNTKNSKLTKDELDVWKQFVWKKPREIFEGEFRLFSEGIDPNDIKQGWLGNWYFLSALVSTKYKNSKINKINFEMIAVR